MPTADTSERDLLAAVNDLAAALDAQREVFRTYLDRLRQMQQRADEDEVVLAGMRSVPGVVTDAASPVFLRMSKAALRLSVESSLCRKAAAKLAFKLKGAGHA
jgi:hypothetical protein